MIKKFYILLLLSGCFRTVWWPSAAQTRLFFSVSALNPVAGNTAVTSLPATIYKTSNCLLVASGLSAYYGITGLKPFALNCPNGPILIRPEIKLFPNPAIHYARVQSTLLLVDHPILQLTVVDASGRKVMQQALSNQQLYAGYSLYLGTLASGHYFLRTESTLFQLVTPFIKVN